MEKFKWRKKAFGLFAGILAFALFAMFSFAVFAPLVWAQGLGTTEPPLEAATFNFQVIIGLLAPLIVIGLTQILKIWIKSKFAPIIVLLLGGISTLIGVGPASSGESFIDNTINVAWVSGFATLIYDLVKKLKMKTTVIKVGAGAIILCFLLSGCAALDQTAYKTLYTSGRTYQGAMSSANQLYMEGKIVPEQAFSIIDKSNYFYLTYQAACDALEVYLKTKSAESKEKLIAALDALSGKSADIKSYIDRIKGGIPVDTAPDKTL